MAGGIGKEYELTFLLKASLDNSIKNFSVVGGQIHELEEQIQRYNATLRDVSAYRQHEQSVADTVRQYNAALAKMYEMAQQHKASIEKYNQASQAVRQHEEAIKTLKARIDEEKLSYLENIAAMKENGASKAEIAAATARHKAESEQLSQALKREKEALTNAKQAQAQAKSEQDAATEASNRAQATKDRLKQKLEEERQKLQQVAEALRAAGIDTKNLEEAEKALNRQLEETTQKQQRLSNLANRINTLADQFRVLQTAAQGALRVLNPINDFWKDSLDAAATLEYGMSAVEAISGATEAEAERLTAVVKEMGATTVYTAKQSADAMQNMALAGWDAEQMIAGLPAVIKMAAAAGEDLSDMTSIVADGMNAFQLAGEDAAVMFADVLAKAATSSNTNVALLGQSLSHVETTAGNLGYSIQDVAIALAVMANNALKGSVSGTALNTSLTRMSGANETAAKAMDKLGLSMYDANGRAKPLLQFLTELRAAFRRFDGDAQSATIAAYKLAGQRGMRGLLAIVGQSDEQFQRLTEDIYNFKGASDEISGIRMDNYTGQMYLLTSAWDALETSIGEKFLPTATEALGLLTDLTNGANDFVQSNGELVRGIATVTLTAAGLFTAVSSIATAIAAVRFALNTLQVGQLLAVVGGFGGLAAIAAAAGVAVAIFTSESVQAQREGTKYAKQLEKQQEEIEKTREETLKAAKAYDEQREYAGRLIDGLADLQEAYRNGTITGQEMQWKIDELNAALPGLGLTFDKTSGKINKTTEEMRAFNEQMREGEEEADADYMETLRQSVEDYEKSLSEAMQKRDEYLRRLKEKYGDKITVNDDYTITVHYTKEDINRHHAVIGYAEQKSVDDFNKSIGETQEALNGARDELEELERAERADTLAKMKELGVGEDLLELYDTTTNALDAVAEAYRKVYAEIEKTYSKQFDLFELVEEKTASMDEMQEALQSQIDYWTKYRENLEKVRTAAQEAGIDLSGMWSWLSSGDEDAAAAVAAMAESIEKDGGAAVEQLAKTYEELLNERGAAVEAAASAWQPDVEAQLAESQRIILEAVKNSEASDEAHEAMKKTFDAYIEEIDTGDGRVNAALSRAANRWKATIANVFTANVPTGNGYVPSSNLRGYAAGTEHAPRGLALVGENGPELMYMRGGEQIIPADKTQKILYDAQTAMERRERNVVELPRVSAEVGTGRGGAYEVTVHFDVSKDATPETVNALFQNEEVVRKLIERALRDRENNARRLALV